MTAQEINQDQIERRKIHEARALAAFHNLKANGDFDIAWRWLQTKFPLYGDTFLAGEEGNTHLAAKRDGQKSVLRLILSMLSTPLPNDFDEDAPPKPREAVSELSTPTP